MNRFTLNAFLVSIIGFAMPFFLKGMILQLLSCLLGIAVFVFFYRDYSINESEKNKLTVGRGVIFGLYAAFFTIILMIAQTLFLPEIIMERALEQTESLRNMIGEAATDTALEQIQNQTPEQLMYSQIYGAVSVIFIDIILGVIVGAIFRFKEEE